MTQIMKPAFIIAVLALVLSLLLISCSVYEAATPITVKVTASPWPATPTISATAVQATPTPQGGGRSSARASLEAEASSVESSTPLAVDIVLDNVVDLYGAEVHLAFDPAIIQVQDADSEASGEQIALGKAFSKSKSFVALNNIDNKRGTIDLAVTLVNPAEPLQGRLVLATFSVFAARAGSADIRFTRILLADRNANALKVVSEGLTLSAKP